MPRRNICVLAILLALALICQQSADRYGRVLGFAIRQIDQGYLEETDRLELFKGAMQGMVGRLQDGNSEYIDPKQSEEFHRVLDQKFGGVGMQVGLDPKTKQLTVISPLVGSPAHNAGILPGDKILRINGANTRGLSLADSVERMQGTPGEPVQLTVLHQGDEEPVEIEIIRAIIRVETVAGDVREEDGSWNYFLEGHDRIGYLRINSFAEETVSEMASAMQWLDERQMRGLIIDVRDNPGGLLMAAVGVCDMFVDSGVIVTTRFRDGQVKTAYLASEADTYGGFPIAVLVNERTASASEVVAACLQDYGRAVVVGQRTYGKGTVQEVIELEPGLGTLKLTTASYWRPSGRNIHHRKSDDEDDDWGVMPNAGYALAVEREERAKLAISRLRRDVYDPAGNNGASSGTRQPEPPADVQLEKAAAYVEQAASGRQ